MSDTPPGAEFMEPRERLTIPADLCTGSLDEAASLIRKRINPERWELRVSTDAEFSSRAIIYGLPILIGLRDDFERDRWELTGYQGQRHWTVWSPGV